MRSALPIAAGLLLLVACNLGVKVKSGQQRSAALPNQAPTPAASPPANGQPLLLEPSSGPPVLLWAVPPAQAALDAVAEDFAKLHDGGWDVVYLDRAQMLETLGTADPAPQVLVFADAETASSLRDASRIEESSLRTFAGDTLVVVSRKDAGWECPSVFDLWELRFSHFGIGDRNATTAGYFGYQALVSDGAWERIKERVLEVPSQAELLEALLVVGNPRAEERRRGRIQLAILPSSTAAVTPGLRGILGIPGDLHEPIRYQLAAAKGHASDPGVANLLRLLAEDPAVQAKLEGYAYLGREAALELQ